MFDLPTYLSDKVREINAALEEYLPPEDRFPELIFQAMRYGALNGGKRIRPILMLAACDAVNGSAEADDIAMPAACAVEFIHAFSLIHDDLPALDNDDLRRGQPTSHKVFGEAIAILAGDALLAFAFQTVTDRTRGVPSDVILDVVRRIASAAGTEGMVTGQVVDMMSEGKEISAETLEFMHRNKTGALIEASVVCGGLLGGANPEQTEALRIYGRAVGLAFQIADDVLDIEGDLEKMGKAVAADIREHKSTYPGIYGLKRSKELALQSVGDAVNALRGFGGEADPLRALARFVIERDA